MRDALSMLAAAALLSTTPAAAQEPAPVPVTVTVRGCEPMQLTVKAGRTTFVVTNRSSRALEWEILKGVMIVDERENIAPGFKQRLTTVLEPGEYEVTCGLLSNPRGRLIVLNPEGGTTAGASKPGTAELIGLAAEYRVWQVGELDRLARAAATGDRATARETFLHLAPLGDRTRPQAQALAGALASTDGDLAGPARAYADAARQASVGAGPLIDGLTTAVKSLAAAGVADRPALLAGIEAPLAHLIPLTKRADAALGTHLEQALAALRAGLDGDGLPDKAAALAADLARLPAALGLS